MNSTRTKGKRQLVICRDIEKCNQFTSEGFCPVEGERERFEVDATSTGDGCLIGL